MNLRKSERISILRGGISDEYKISVLTADQVFETLKKKYETSIINVDNNYDKLIRNLKKYQPNKVFNCLHGSFGEDGQIQSILNYLKIPYTHSGVLASALAMNKVLSKKIFKALGISHPRTINNLSKCEFPLIIKPISGGSSNGLNKIETRQDLINFEKNNSLEKFIIEEFIEGREITVGILEDKICGIMEIVFENELYDYKNKYEEIAVHIINPELPEDIIDKIKKYSLTVHKELNCRCLSRLDFRYNSNDNKIYLLEINTQPGLTKNSLLPEMARDLGIDFLQLCETILSSAQCEEI